MTDHTELRLHVKVANVLSVVLSKFTSCMQINATELIRISSLHGVGMKLIMSLRINTGLLKLKSLFHLIISINFTSLWT